MIGSFSLEIASNLADILFPKKSGILISFLFIFLADDMFFVFKFMAEMLFNAYSLIFTSKNNIQKVARFEVLVFLFFFNIGPSLLRFDLPVNLFRPL